MLGLNLLSVYAAEEEPDIEHNWSEWIIDKEPGCTENGEMHRVCTSTKLHHREIQVITALGHDYSKEITLSATYDKEGIITYTCEHCTENYTESIPKLAKPAENVEQHETEETVDAETGEFNTSVHEHQYEIQSQVLAACEESGYINYICEICGENNLELIKATGHNFGEWVMSKEATLFQAGLKNKVCINNHEHILTEDIPRIINFKVNTADVFMTPFNTCIILFFALTFFSDLYIILWDLRMRHKKDKAQNLKTRYLLLSIVLTCLIFGLPIILKLFIGNITYLNLVGITATSAIMPTGIFICLKTRRRVKALNGNKGIYEIGTQKGDLISKNHSK